MEMQAFPGPRRKSDPSTPGLRFGVFEMDLASGEIRKSGVLVRLPPQPFRLLALLAQHPGEVLTREAIREQLWNDGTVVEFDHRLNSCINQIRGLLGDDAEVPRYVETLPKRGYRWIGPVELVGRPRSSTDVPPLRLASPAPWRTEDSEEPTRSSPRPKRARRLLVRAALVLAGIVLALAGVALVSWLRPAPVPEWTRLTFRRGSVTAARFGRNGEILYSAAWDGQPAALYVARNRNIDERALDVGSGEVVGASPQGEVIFRTRGAGGSNVLARAPLAGGARKELIERVATADVAADGTTFALAVREGTRMRVEFPPGKSLYEVDGAGISHLRISRDGRQVAFLEHPVPGDDRGRVVLVEVGGHRRVLADDWASAEGLAWSADGREVWFTAARSGADTTLYGVDLSGHQRTILPSMGRIVIQDVSPEGRVVIDRVTSRAGISFGREGAGERDLPWFDMPEVAALTPDGRQLLFTESGEGGGREYAVYLRATDGSPPVRLGTGHATGLSPDGRWALSIPVTTQDRIDLLPTGAGTPRSIQDPGIREYVWAGFFPDGERILFVGREPGRERRLYVRALSGGPARPLEASIEGAMVITPDGRALLGMCAEEGPCLQPLDGAAARPVAGLQELYPLWWDASGKTVFAREWGKGGAAVIHRVNPTTGERVPWRTLAPADSVGVMGINRIVGTPDGAAWAYSYIRRLSEVFLVDGLR